MADLTPRPSEWSDCLDAGCGTCDACRALEVTTHPSAKLCGEPTAKNAGRCQHAMYPRCPCCHVEVYAPAVWGFSHAEFPCNCGWKIVPKMRWEAPDA